MKLYGSGSESESGSDQAEKEPSIIPEPKIEEVD
jgi:hypothetical protein